MNQSCPFSNHPYFPSKQLPFRILYIPAQMSQFYTRKPPLLLQEQHVPSNRSLKIKTPLIVEVSIHLFGNFIYIYNNYLCIDGCNNCSTFLSIEGTRQRMLPPSSQPMCFWWLISSFLVYSADQPHVVQFIVKFFGNNSKFFFHCYFF